MPTARERMASELDRKQVRLFFGVHPLEGKPMVQILSLVLAFAAGGVLVPLVVEAILRRKYMKLSEAVQTFPGIEQLLTLHWPESVKKVTYEERCLTRTSRYHSEDVTQTGDRGFSYHISEEIVVVGFSDRTVTKLSANGRRPTKLGDLLSELDEERLKQVYWVAVVYKETGRDTSMVVWKMPQLKVRAWVETKKQAVAA